MRRYRHAAWASEGGDRVFVFGGLGVLSMDQPELDITQLSDLWLMTR